LVVTVCGSQILIHKYVEAVMTSSVAEKPTKSIVENLGRYYWK
jgi:hypothetical protein